MSVYDYFDSAGDRWWAWRKRHRGQRKHERGFRRKEDAATAERNWMNAVDAQKTGAALKITVKELAIRWLRHQAHINKPSTLKDYESSLRRLIVPAIGHRKVGEIRPLDIQALVDRIAFEHTPRTANKICAPLRQMFKQAVAWGFITYNPCADIKHIPERKSEIDCLNAADAIKLLDMAEGRERGIIALAMVAGLRQGEIIGLQWKDIDWFRGLLRVRRTYLDGRFHEPKTSYSKRDIILPSWLRRDLAGYYRDQDGPAPDALVFPSKAGTPLGRSNLVRRIYHPALDRAGLRHVSFHSLRHTYASILISKGVDSLFVSRQLGHSKIGTTHDLYGHLMHDRKEQRKLLDGILPGPNRAKDTKQIKKRPGA